jgi:hypothetical protein
VEQIDRAAFADTRDALFLIRLLNALEQRRRDSPELEALIGDVERRNGFCSSVPLVNQASFLQFAYMTLVRTRAAYFEDRKAEELLELKVRGLVSQVTFGGDRDKERTGVALVKWMRNALAHSRVEVDDRVFVFTDIDDRSKKRTTVTMTMPWPVLGQICEAVVSAGNALLYPENEPEEYWPVEP